MAWMRVIARKNVKNEKSLISGCFWNHGWQAHGSYVECETERRTKVEIKVWPEEQDNSSAGNRNWEHQQTNRLGDGDGQWVSSSAELLLFIYT